MQLFSTLRKLEHDKWSTASWWLGFTLVFGTMPVWTTLIMVRILPQNMSVYQITDQGQLLVYSFAFLATGLYFVGREFKATAFPGRQGFLLILGILFALALSAYVCIVLTGVLEKEVIAIDFAVLRLISIVTFVITLIIVFIGAALNESLVHEDMKALRSKEMTQLGEEFDRLGGKDE